MVRLFRKDNDPAMPSAWCMEPVFTGGNPYDLPMARYKNRFPSISFVVQYNASPNALSRAGCNVKELVYPVLVLVSLNSFQNNEGRDSWIISLDKGDGHFYFKVSVTFIVNF